MEIAAKDVKGLLMGVYRRHRNGEISAAESRHEVFLLNSVLRSIEVTDLQERLGKIEAMLRRN